MKNKNKKYELTTDTKFCLGKRLFRIKALISFGKVKAGDLGGYIEKEENLSHDGNAWVYDEAKVCGNAKVSGDAEVYGDACVSGDALVLTDAKVSGNALVFDRAEVGGKAVIYGNAKVYGKAEVYGKSKVFDEAEIYGNAWVCGDSCVYCNAKVSGDAKVSGNACVCGNAKVSGDAKVSCDAWVCDDADYLCFKGLGSQNQSTTFFKSKDGHIHVLSGRFIGNLTTFEKRYKLDQSNNKYVKEYLACIEVVKIHFEV